MEASTNLVSLGPEHYSEWENISRIVRLFIHKPLANEMSGLNSSPRCKSYQNEETMALQLQAHHLLGKPLLVVMCWGQLNQTFGHPCHLSCPLPHTDLRGVSQIGSHMGILGKSFSVSTGPILS